MHENVKLGRILYLGIHNRNERDKSWDRRPYAVHNIRFQKGEMISLFINKNHLEEVLAGDRELCSIKFFTN